MSSFSRRKLNMKNTNIDAGDVASNARKSGRNKGFIFLSIFGALCAVLWVLVGTVKVLGRSTS
uniref:No apical meristem family protein n=1 Tax=Rhizophora mucronata TaxID=61149 RepID=A0A2P2NQT4_RHIMU